MPDAPKPSDSQYAPRSSATPPTSVQPISVEEPRLLSIIEGQSITEGRQGAITIKIDYSSSSRILVTTKIWPIVPPAVATEFLADFKRDLDAATNENKNPQNGFTYETKGQNTQKDGVEINSTNLNLLNPTKAHPVITELLSKRVDRAAKIEPSITSTEPETSKPTSQASGFGSKVLSGLGVISVGLVSLLAGHTEGRKFQKEIEDNNKAKLLESAKNEQDFAVADARAEEQGKAVAAIDAKIAELNNLAETRVSTARKSGETTTTTLVNNAVLAERQKNQAATEESVKKAVEKAVEEEQVATARVLPLIIKETYNAAADKARGDLATPGSIAGIEEKLDENIPNTDFRKKINAARKAAASGQKQPE